MSIQQDRIRELVERKASARLGGGQEKIDARHERGKLTARERLDILLDKGSFEEIDMLARNGEGVVTGIGTIDGRPVYVYSQDFTVSGGSMSEMMARKICKIADMALMNGAPLVCINESGGARIQEGLGGLAGLGEIFTRQITASGVIPQISGVFGPCAGGAVYSPALSDFTVMLNDTSYMYLTGPDVVKAATGETTGHEELGGSAVHASRSGVAHFTADNEAEGLFLIRALLSFMPSNNKEQAPFRATDDPAGRVSDELNSIIPDDPCKAYDMHEVIGHIVDDGEFLEVHKSWAKNIIVGFAHMNGRSTGIVANQPAVLAGALDSDASRKAARFIRFCDAFNIPVISLIDVPGFLCGKQQEHGGIISHGAKLLYAYGEATVPKVAVTLRKSYGGAYITMSSKHMRSDINLAWPSASFGVMGSEAAVRILHGKDMEDCTGLPGSPYTAAGSGHIDDIIEPRNTRFRIIRALEYLADKKLGNPWKKHDNMPL